MSPRLALGQPDWAESLHHNTQEIAMKNVLLTLSVFVLFASASTEALAQQATDGVDCESLSGNTSKLLCLTGRFRRSVAAFESEVAYTAKLVAPEDVTSSGPACFPSDNLPITSECSIAIQQETPQSVGCVRGLLNNVRQNFAEAQSTLVDRSRFLLDGGSAGVPSEVLEQDNNAVGEANVDFGIAANVFSDVERHACLSGRTGVASWMCPGGAGPLPDLPDIQKGDECVAVLNPRGTDQVPSPYSESYSELQRYFQGLALLQNLLDWLENIEGLDLDPVANSCSSPFPGISNACNFAASYYDAMLGQIPISQVPAFTPFQPFSAIDEVQSRTFSMISNPPPSLVDVFVVCFNTNSASTWSSMEIAISPRIFLQLPIGPVFPTNQFCVAIGTSS